MEVLSPVEGALIVVGVVVFFVVVLVAAVGLFVLVLVVAVVGLFVLVVVVVGVVFLAAVAGFEVVLAVFAEVVPIGQAQELASVLVPAPAIKLIEHI